MSQIVGPQGYASKQGWLLLNNVWNPDGLTLGVNYSISAETGTDTLTAGTTFNWSLPPNTLPWDNVRAYPDLLFGASPWGRGESDPGHIFPIQVSDLHTLTASFNLDWAGDASGFDVSYDIWFTGTPNGGLSSITNEVMVWMHRGDLSGYGTVIGTYTDGDFSAKIYHTGTYTALISDTDVKAGTINVTKVIQKLEQLNIVAPTEYLTSVQLGAEIVQGTGSLTVNQADLNIVSSDATHLTATTITGSGTTAVADLQFVTGTAAVLNAKGIGAGTTSTRMDSAGAIVIQHYNASSKFAGAKSVSLDASGITLTQHFDQSWQFTGAESSKLQADGSELIQHFGSTWQFTGAEGVSKTTDGSILTQHFDQNWAFMDADSKRATADGSMLTQYFNTGWQFTGADSTSVEPNDEVLTQHFTSSWSFAGADLVTRTEDGKTVDNHVDQNWQAVSASSHGIVAPITSDLVVGFSDNWLKDDANFTVLVDGHQVGGTYSAAALQSAGQVKTIEWHGLTENFAVHDVAIQFLTNPFNAGSAAQPNYVNSVSWDGNAVSTGSISLAANNLQHFSVSAPSGWTG